MKKRYLWAIPILAIVAILLFSGAGLEIVSRVYDVDSDGDIDTFDVIVTHDQIPVYSVQYDVDGDSDVDMFDVILIFDNIGNTPGDGGDTILDWFVNVIWG